MGNTSNRIKSPETLRRIGELLRARRESLGLAQARVIGMRQATVSAIERGSDVTVDTLVGYANALGLEIAFAPIGQGVGVPVGGPATGTGERGLDLLEEFADLQDEEQ